MEMRIEPASMSVLNRRRSLQELATMRETWVRALVHLEAERAIVLRNAEALNSGQESKDSLRLLIIAYKAAMFEMCIDRVNEQEETLDERPNPERVAGRARYFRLMSAMAKAGNDKADDNDHIHYVRPSTSGDEAWSGEQWVSELEIVATQARHSLIKTPTNAGA